MHCSGSPFYNGDGAARISYYFSGTFYIPHGIVDGLIDAGTGYSQWGNFVRGRAIVDSPIRIVLEGDYSSPPNGMVRVHAEAVDFMSFNSLRMFVAITEDGIFYNAPNGTQYHHQVLRDLIPFSSGDPISLSYPGETITKDYNFTIGGSWVGDSCNVVVFIQDYNTKEIVQSAVSRINQLQIGVAESDVRHLTAGLALSPSRPNPFRDRTQIDYTLPSTGQVELRVYDSSGSVVRTLLRGTQSAGKHTEGWDGRDEHGNEVASGVYFSKLIFGEETRIGKISVVR